MSSPLPDEFDAAFVTGNVCMPSIIATGTAPGNAPKFPIRMETCVYRCVQVDDASVEFNYFWSCVGEQCQMQLLLTAHVRRVGGQEDCDARQLPAPPASECTQKIFNFDAVPPPAAQDGSYRAGPFLVTVPYLDFDQGNNVVSRLNNGEAPQVVIPEVVGAQNFPQRQFLVTFDPAAPPTTVKASELTADTCHPIAAP
jgi:hypothetical protein